MQATQILNIYTPAFKSNNGYYKRDCGNEIGTYTTMFRSDLDWEKFTDFIVKHFKNKENVQFVQFASSDGSEAYTQIISLLENYENKDTNKFLPIQAYEINKEIFDTAQSGLINLNKIDIQKLGNKGISFEKYFTESKNEVSIKNDSLTTTDNKNIITQTYKANGILTDNVKFNNKDMKDVLRNLNDDSNTIIMCRNVLDYFTDREIDHFTTLAASVLRHDSVFVTGEIDNPRVDLSLQQKGFVKVMPYVYVIQ